MYRPTIRKVDVKNGDSGEHIIVSIKDYASLQDGVNVQETYILVKVTIVIVLTRS